MNVNNYLKANFYGYESAGYPTPFFLYSQNRLVSNALLFQNIANTLFRNAKVYYAVKAAFIGKIIESLDPYVDGFDIMSTYEYHAIKSSKIPEQKLLLNSPYKEPVIVQNIKKAGGIVIADNLNEVREYSLNQKSKFAVRLNDCNCNEDHFISNNRFGVSFQQFQDQNIDSSVPVLFHMHALSRTKEHGTAQAAYQDTMSKIAGWSGKNSRISIDFGGGFDSNLRMGTEQKLKEILSEYAELASMIKYDSIYFEPGRYFVEDAGILVTTVKNIKECQGVKWLIVDASTDFLIPLQAARFEVVDMDGENGEGDLYTIADGTCSPAGIIKKNVRLKNVKAGDRLIVLNAGSYTYSLAETFYNIIPPSFFVNMDKSIQEIFTHEAGVQIANLIYGGNGGFKV